LLVSIIIVTVWNTRRCEMRTTLSGYYRNLNFDQNKTAKELFDVTKQISSGHKIEYAFEDTAVFVNTMRLDNEMTTLVQVKQNSMKALQVSTNTDTTMNDMTKNLESMKVALLSASTASNSPESMQALAAQLRGLESNLMQLANTSIDGKYLFSGSQITTKPIDANGVYQGNGEQLKAFLGSGVEQTYNINGADLFLGDENDTQRKITLNIPHFNQALLHPDVMVDTTLTDARAQEVYITENSTIRELMGDNDTTIDVGVQQHHFYVRGTDHDGVGFKQTISMSDDESVSDLMNKIGTAFGNTPSNALVSVSLNEHGQIEIEDKRPASSKLDFHMVANTDPGPPVTDINLLNTNGTNVVSFMKSDFTEYVQDLGQRQSLYNTDSYSLAGDYITHSGEITQSTTLLADILDGDVVNIELNGTNSAGVAVVGALFPVGAATTMQDLINALKTNFDPAGNLSFSIKDGEIIFDSINGASPIDISLQAQDAGGTAVSGLPGDASVVYGASAFLKEGNRLMGGVAQVLNADNSFAKDSTKLSEVFDTIVPGTSSLRLEGVQADGVTPYGVDINLNNPVTVTGSLNFTVLDALGAATNASDMTYRQLMDVVNLVVTGTNPGATAASYTAAITAANAISNVSLDQSGNISYQDLSATDTQTTLSLFDNNINDFTNTTGSIANFNANNALTIADPKTDFFAQINAAIESVELSRTRADGTLGDPRNNGIQNAIAALDNLSDHLYNQHAVAGVQSQTLQSTVDRTDLLIVTTQTLRSESIDVDIASASLELKQLELNYQAMLSSVSKISQLSLVNYL